MSEHEPLRPLSASQRVSLEEATSRYEAAVTAADVAWLRGRGLTPEVAGTFRLGVVRDPLPGHESHRGKLAIPYLDKNDETLSIRFRCIQEHNHREFGHGKYMSLPDEPVRVFNIRAIHTADNEIHVCEGEFDAMTLCQVGLPAIAIPGVQAWRSHHRRMLAGFSRIWVWGDPDEAGADFNRKIERAMRQAKGVRIRGGDVNETYKANGAEALHALIEREQAQL